MNVKNHDTACTVLTCDHVQDASPAVPLPSDTQIELAAQMCHALSDPARIRLLLRLAHGPLCVSELVACEGARLSSVSARLKTLHAARLVTRRRQAKHIFYALADEHIQDLLRNILNHAAETA